MKLLPSFNDTRRSRRVAYWMVAIIATYITVKTIIDLINYGTL